MQIFALFLGCLAASGLLSASFLTLRMLFHAAGFYAAFPASAALNLLLGAAYYRTWWAPWLAAALTLGWQARPKKPAREKDETATLTRRGLLVGAAAAGVSTWGIVYGVKVEPRSIELTHLDVPIQGLPEKLDGLKVVVMSDWHCGPFNSQDFLRQAIDLSNLEKPDLVLLPGDFIQYDTANFCKAAELIEQLKTRIPHGVLATMGNHDRGADWEFGVRQMERAGARFMDHKALRLGADRNWQDGWSAQGLCVAGLGDLWTDKILLEETLGPVPDALPRLVLAHNPDTAEKHQQKRVDLMVSGHTHGGQVRFPLLGAPVIPSLYGQKYVQGLVQAPAYPVYVTRGIGTIDVPVRFGAPPEIAVIRLVRA